MDAGRGESAERASSINTSATQAATTPAALTTELAHVAGSQPLIHDRDSDSDASSDMDVSESDEDPEPAGQPQRPEPPAAVANGAQSAGAKRKMSDVVTNHSSPIDHELFKKPRLSPSPSLPTTHAQPPSALQKHPDSSKRAEAKKKKKKPEPFPVEIWQRIFSYLPPAMLGRCVSQCKMFHTCLTASKPEGDEDTHGQGPSATNSMDSNKIWTNARRLWLPKLPKPLVGMTELQMLQLIGGSFCQSCHREPMQSAAPTSILDAGPGLEGVRVIWPFGVRLCGPCLQAKTMNDIAMLKSPAATLASGIPHILMTNGLSYIPEIQRPALGNIPAQHRPPIDKVYFKDHIDAIVAEHRHAAELGAAEEWRKGLFKKGKDAMADASRWEKWEAQIRPGSDVAMTLKEYDPSSFPDRLAEAKRKSAASQHQQPAALTNGTSPSHAPPFTPYLPQPGQHTQATPAIQQMAYPGIPAPPASQGWPPQQVSRPNHILQDPEERRQARKEEIERRCLQLDPPLDPSALPYMESFRNAMQIVQPMTDQAWATLEPLLLAQREAAELQAHHKAEQLAALRATLPSHGDDIYRNLKPAKELYDKDKEYDDVQEPLRRKLVEYVEEYVNTAWNGNPVLDSSTTPVFAANAILHVYKRYTEEDAAGLTPKPDLVAINARRRQDNQLESPFLSLDNMKWLFENKIRAYLDPTCSSIFLCAECLEESPKLEKWFAFEGLIQHFGAKHTTSFSRGNVTVYWQVAEWPAEPPFFPKPEDYIRPLLAILRKAAGFKGRGNAKNTPQPRRDAPYKAPVTIKSESFYNSNGHHGGAHGYSSSSYDQSNHHGANRGGWQSETQSPRFKVEQPDALDEVKADRFAADVREVWDALEGVSAKDMLNCIRVHTVFHHTNDRILSEFGVVPTLDIVTDAFAINAAMQPIKTAGGLACKQCVANQTDGSAGYQSYYSRIKSVKLYNLGGLINHFKIQHLPQMPYVIWMRDMMELPEAQLIKDLARVQGMDMEKFKLIAAAFPDALPDPVGALMADSTGISSDGRAISGAGVASKFMEGLTKKKPAQPQSRKKIKREGSDTPAARAGSQEGGFPEPLEHEYDPRKPMASREQDGEDDDARFDTDVARRKASAAKAAAAAATPNYFGLAPETLRAIQTLGIQQAPAVAGYGHGGSAGEVKMDRAPSVGRDDYAAAPAPAAPPPSTASNSNVQPNIAAILASLTNGGNAPPPLPSPQVTTPVEQNRGSRHSSISRSGHRSDGGVEQLYRSLSTSYPNQGQDRPSTSGYPAYTAPPPPPSTYYQPQQVQYRPSIEPPTPSPRYEMPPGHDLQAALQRNARHFSQNAAPPPQPSALAYAAAPSPQQAHIAPPRYAYPPQQYDDGYGQGYYASVPQPQPQQRTVYVDEHGREVQLIPVEQYGRYAQGPQGQEFFYGTGR